MRLTVQISPSEFANLSVKAEEWGVDTIEEVIRHLVSLKKPSQPPTLPATPPTLAEEKSPPIVTKTGRTVPDWRRRRRKKPACSRCGNSGHNIATCAVVGRSPDEKGEARRPLTPEERTEAYRRKIEKRCPGMIERLGVDSDLNISLDYNVSRQRVHQIRQRLGIECSFKPFVFPEEAAPSLGTMSDKALAERLETTPYNIRIEREKRGIPVFEYVPQNEEKIKAVAHLVGVISDPKVAKMIGVPPQAIYNYRQKYGIETKVISPKHKDFVKIDLDEVARLFHEGKTDEEIAEAVGSTPGTVVGIRNRLRLLRQEHGLPLSDTERETITRLRSEGHSMSEIARRLNRPHSTVAAFVRRSKG